MANIRLKYLSITGILFIFCVIGYFLFKSGDKGNKSVVINEPPPKPGVVAAAKNFHYAETNPDEGTKFEIDADEGTEDKERAILSTFRLKLEPLFSPSMKIKGKKAEIDKNQKMLYLSGDLQGDSSNGYKIFTEHLIYDQKKGVLKTNEPVKITGPFFSMTGRGLISYPEKGTVKILPYVTTIIELREGL